MQAVILLDSLAEVIIDLSMMQLEYLVCFYHRDESEVTADRPKIFRSDIQDEVKMFISFVAGEGGEVNLSFLSIFYMQYRTTQEITTFNH